VPDANRDKRSHRRYPITLDVEYKLLKRGRVIQIGSGKTLDISSHGVLFEANEALAPGDLIELKMTWPFLLEGVPLKLALRGRVVRVDDGKRIAVRVTYREFHTARPRRSN
jgi:hypothetical protein